MRRASTLIALSLLAATGSSGQAPAPPTPPANLPLAHTPEWGAELARGEGFDDAYLGAGHLGPADGGGAGHDWIGRARVPLYEKPGGAPYGWLAHGWIVSSDGARQPLPPACLVETSYESSSIIVNEIRGDGWFRIAVDPPCSEGGHWIHRDQLDLGEQALLVEPWETFLFRDDVSLLSFRQAGIPHALRVAPRADAERRGWIGADHSIEPLETTGDWMRVRVHQPSNYCIAVEDWRGSRQEGWVRWRDEAKGPWLFVWSRGC